MKLLEIHCTVICLELIIEAEFLWMKLEKKGYVRKRVCSKDRRVMHLELGERAEEVIGVIFDVSEIFHRKVEQILEKDEIDTLKRIMSKLLEKW